MPAFMKYQGVDGSTQESQRDYIEVVSYSLGGSQLGPDVHKGTWLADVTHDRSLPATTVDTATNTGSADAGRDGTSNTLLLAEMHLPDDDYVLTFVEHAGQPISTDPGLIDDLFVFGGAPDASGGEDSWGLWQINAQPDATLGEPVTFTATVTVSQGGAVATETLTIAHEGFLLL